MDETAPDIRLRDGGTHLMALPANKSVRNGMRLLVAAMAYMAKALDHMPRALLHLAAMKSSLWVC